jgi:ABC-type antimicrobial peptide transport system permease subunit
VGVVKDFYSQSLHSPVRPLAFASIPSVHSQLHIALKQGAAPGQWQQTISQIEKKFKSIYPEEEFSYKFFDESIAKFYEREKNTSRLLTWATGLAIIISCLGLLGLAIYTLNQRTKEIGIRKVLGASITQIVSLVSKDFLKLVMIAFFIAAPIAWYGMNKWLQNFAYHDNISGWLFVAAGVMMLLVAMITLGFQTIKAAAANPVKSLRSE